MENADTLSPPPFFNFLNLQTCCFNIFSGLGAGGPFGKIFIFLGHEPKNIWGIYRPLSVFSLEYSLFYSRFKLWGCDFAIDLIKSGRIVVRSRWYTDKQYGRVRLISYCWDEIIPKICFLKISSTSNTVNVFGRGVFPRPYSASQKEEVIIRVKFSFS